MWRPEQWHVRRGAVVAAARAVKAERPGPADFPPPLAQAPVQLADALAALAVVRVLAVRPGAVNRPGREDAPLVDLAAQRADDRKAG